jgi:hypothetical protein
VKVRVVNHLWVTADVQIEVGTGAAKSVLHLVNRDEEATAFGRKTAENIRGFVQRRVNDLNSETPVTFSLRPSKVPVGLWVVYGIQEFELDSES